MAPQGKTYITGSAWPQEPYPVMGGRTGLPGGTARGPPGHERSPGTLSPEALRFPATLLPGAEASPGVSPSPGKIIYPRTAMPTRSILPGSGTILGFSLPGAAEAKHRRVIICYPEASQSLHPSSPTTFYPVVLSSLSSSGHQSAQKNTRQTSPPCDLPGEDPGAMPRPTKADKPPPVPRARRDTDGGSRRS